MENLQIAVKLASQAIESARVADRMYREGFPSWGLSAYLKASRWAMKAHLLATSECFTADSEEAFRAFEWVSALCQVIESHLVGA